MHLSNLVQQAFSYPKEPTGRQQPWFGGSLRVQLCKPESDSEASDIGAWKPLQIHNVQTRCDTTVLSSTCHASQKKPGSRSKSNAKEGCARPVKIQTDVTWGFVESEANTRFAIQVDYLSRLGKEAKTWKVDDWVELSIFFDGSAVPDISTCKTWLIVDVCVFVFVGETLMLIHSQPLEVTASRPVFYTVSRTALSFRSEHTRANQTVIYARSKAHRVAALCSLDLAR
jgi:hypothetical protein